uniref:Uncharacterized protein n=1 Tax=Steinernema glaseri TaxID=37863 RepID=A0A1I7ZWC7_9BILA
MYSCPILFEFPSDSIVLIRYVGAWTYRTTDYPEAKRPLGRPRARWEDGWKQLCRNWRRWSADEWDHIRCAYVRCELI